MFNPYPWMQPPSILEQIEALDKYKEELIRKHEEDKKKKVTEKKTKETKSFGFFEGLVVAYIAQILYGPVTKLLAVWLASHGVQ